MMTDNALNHDLSPNIQSIFFDPRVISETVRCSDDWDNDDWDDDDDDDDDWSKDNKRRSSDENDDDISPSIKAAFLGFFS